MKKLFFLTLTALFIFSGLQAADSYTDEVQNSQEIVVNDIEQTADDAPKLIQSEKFSKKEFRKFRKDAKKEIKNILKTHDSTMMLVGGAIMIFGLLLYLVVTSATWLGIAVMVIGLLLLLYGLLKRFF
jgi:Flp pilus assembly protein TadB